MKSLDVLSKSDEETRALGEQVGRLAEPGDVYLLEGTLGAGKTTLTQGIARGLDVEGYASSPTFTLVNEYAGRIPLYHIDLYRLTGASEVYDLGLDEYLFGPGATVVEWADRAIEAMPEEHLLMVLQYAGENIRKLHLDAKGKRYELLLDELAKARSNLP